MKVVGIKQLKARLSEYVRLAKAGETVLVTECAQRKTERSLWISRSGGDLLIKFLG